MSSRDESILCSVEPGKLLDSMFLLKSTSRLLCRDKQPSYRSKTNDCHVLSL